MERDKLIVLLTSIVLVLVLVLSGCEGGGGGGTSGDKDYRVLSPRGIQMPVETVALAERLDTLDGKNMWVTQAEADPIIMPALWERLQEEFPNASWHMTESSMRGPKKLTAEEMETAGAIIQGVAW